MARPLRIEFADAYYHVMTRGIEKRAIFVDQNDSKRYIQRLKENLQRYSVELYSYVLMKNHLHLFIQTHQPNLSRFMHDLNTAYTVYFNTRRQRVGPLLQGRYKSVIVERDSYMLELTRYIHLNPVRAKMVERAEDYLWSSYRSYIHRRHDDMVNIEWVKERFGSGWQRQYRRFVEDGINPPNPLDNVVAGCILGSDEFVQEIKERISVRKWDREVPSLKVLKKPTIDTVIQATSQYYNADPMELVNRRRAHFPRKVAIYLARKYSCESVRTIGDRFSIGSSAVAKLVRRTIEERKQNRNLNKSIEKIEELLLCAYVKT